MVVFEVISLALVIIVAALLIKWSEAMGDKLDAEREAERLRRKLKERPKKWARDEYLRGHRDAIEYLADRMREAGAPKAWVDSHQRAIEFADKHLSGGQDDTN